MKRHVALLLMIVISIPFSASVCSSEIAEAKEYEQIFDGKREKYIETKKKISSEYEQKIASIDKENSELQERINKISEDFESIEKKKNKNIGFTVGVNLIEAIAIKTLYSVFLVPSIFIFPKLLEILFIVTVLNINIYLFYSRKNFFRKYKKLIIICTIILLLLFLSPAFFGSQASAKEASTLETKMEVAASICKMTELQRTILKMEEYEEYKDRRGNIIKIPEIKTDNEKLIPLNEVTVGNADFYFTLAALYLAEGRKGDAVDAVENIFNSETHLASAQIGIAVKGIEFLIDNGQLDRARIVAQTIISRLQNFKMAVELMGYFEKAGMRATAIEILRHAVNIGIKDSYSSCTSIINDFIDSGQLNYARVAIEQGMNHVTNIDTGIPLIKYAQKAGFEGLVSYGIEKSSQEFDSWENLYKFTKFLVENNLKESAIGIIAQTIDDVRKNPNNRAANLLRLIDLSIKLELLEQAIIAANKLYVTERKNIKHIDINPSNIMENDEKLPIKDGSISFVTFLGAIEEKAGFPDKAKFAYRESIMWRLDDIIESYGLDKTQGINDFYYATPIIKEDESISLETFDTIYSAFEAKHIEDHKKIFENELLLAQKANRNLNAEHQEKSLALKKIKYKNRIVLANMIAHVMRTIALILLISILLIGCFIRAWEYTKQINEYRVFAFISKFFESIGWAQILTVINVIPGLFVVFVSQIMLIFQKKEQLMQQFVANSTKQSL